MPQMVGDQGGSMAHMLEDQDGCMAYMVGDQGGSMAYMVGDQGGSMAYMVGDSELTTMFGCDSHCSHLLYSIAAVQCPLLIVSPCCPIKQFN